MQADASTLQKTPALASDAACLSVTAPAGAKSPWVPRSTKEHMAHVPETGHRYVMGMRSVAATAPHDRGEQAQSGIDATDAWVPC